MAVVPASGDDPASVKPHRRFDVGLTVEALLLMLMVWTVFRVLGVLVEEGRLPPPYFLNPNDTLMDLTNVAWWSDNPGAYYAYQSIYPPVSFVFLKVFTLHECYRFDSYFARDCDWLAPSVLCFFYLLSNTLIFLTFRKRDKRTALVRALAMAIGLPMLYGMERGNLVIVCMTFFVLGNGRLLKAAWLRWLCVGITINFKPYLILTLIPHAVTRRWRWFEGATLMAILFYMLTFAALGAGSPTGSGAGHIRIRNSTGADYI